MIDKKPFRVTNEQVMIAVSEENQVIELDKYHSDIWSRDIAADIIDARELINKQESIIKEIREILEAITVCGYDSMKPDIIHSVLEKTKDYA